jgi:predicted TIM-barrel fold metal-dependent hydrolase
VTPAIRVVDAHHHLWDVDVLRYAWLAEPRHSPVLGDYTELARNYLATDYRRDVATVDVIASVHVQAEADDPVAETRWLSERAAVGGVPSVIVAGCRLEDPAIERRLNEQLEFERVTGVRQMLNWHPQAGYSAAASGDLMASPAWRRGYALLERHGLSFDLQVYPHQLTEAAQLAGAYPDTRMMLNHGGLLALRNDAERRERVVGLGVLARQPNVYVKVSGFALAEPHPTLEKMRAWFHELLDLFGSSRCMIGSNLPVEKLLGGHDSLAVLATLCEELSPAESEAVRIRTAFVAYRIAAG